MRCMTVVVLPALSSPMSRSFIFPFLLMRITVKSVNWLLLDKWQFNDAKKICCQDKRNTNPLLLATLPLGDARLLQMQMPLQMGTEEKYAPING